MSLTEEEKQILRKEIEEINGIKKPEEEPK